MPVIAGLFAALKPRAAGRHVVRIVESDESRAVWRVQRERVRQAVWSLAGRLDTSDLELDPVALFEMVNTSIESQQELKAVVRGGSRHIT